MQQSAVIRRRSYLQSIARVYATNNLGKFYKRGRMEAIENRKSEIANEVTDA